MLLGGIQDDELRVSGENITAAGGLGNDRYHGDSGSATYIFDLGDGQDTIHDQGGQVIEGEPTANRLILGEGITLDSLQLNYNVDFGAYISFAESPTDAIRLGYFDRQNVTNGQRTIDEVEFADGTVISWSDLTNQLGFEVSTVQSSSIFGTSVDDRINSTSEDESIFAGAGSDTISFGAFAGHDIVENDTPGSAEVDVVQLDASVTPAGVSTFKHQNDLIVRIDASGDRLLVKDFFTSSAVKEVRFANGTTYTAANVPQAAWSNASSSADNDIFRTASNNTLDASGGNDLLAGGAGDDTLSGGTGDDTVRGEAGSDIVRGNSGYDELDGGSGNDLLIPGTGKLLDLGGVMLTLGGTVRGGEGNDTLEIASGDGTVTFIDTEGANVIRFGSGVTQNDLRVVRPTTVSADVLFYYSANNYIDMSLATFNSLSAIELSGGGSLSPLQIAQLYDPTTAVVGDGRVNVNLPVGELTLERRGDDLFIRYSGEVIEWVETGDLDTKRALYLAGTADSFGLAGGGDALVLPNWYRAAQGSYLSIIDSWWTAAGIGSPIDLYASAWSLPRRVDGTAGADTLTGTTDVDELHGLGGNDTLLGDAADDVLQGDTGSDSLQGGVGNDVYRFSIGDGNDIITDTSGSDDVLRFGTGITATDLAVTESVDGLRVQIGVPANGDEVLITDWALGGEKALDRFVFDNGASLDRAAIDQLNTGNHSPRAAQAIPNQRLRSGQPFSLVIPAAAFSDADAADMLTYQATLADGQQLPSWLSFDPVTRTLSGTPGSTDGALLDIRVHATDLAGLTAETDFRMDVMERIDGTNGPDNLVATGPNGAEIFGLDGDDYLQGATGNDELYGGAGADYIDSAQGDDYIDAGPGNDYLGNWRGNDIFVGGPGNDELYLSLTPGDAEVVRTNLGDGTDRVTFEALGDEDAFEFGSGITPAFVLANMRLDEDGNWLIRYNPANPTDMLVGADWLYEEWDQRSSGAQVRFASGETYTLGQLFGAMNQLTHGDDSYVADGSAPVHALEGNDVLFGKASGDPVEIYGDGGDDFIDGGPSWGGSLINGGTGDDRLFGSGGIDTIVGGEGDDWIEGGYGADILQGGAGNDSYTLWLSGSLDGTTVEVTDTGGWDHFLFSLHSFDYVTFSRQGDDLVMGDDFTSPTSSVVFKRWFEAPQYRIEQMTFNSSGELIPYTAAQIEGLVTGVNSAPNVRSRLPDVGVAVGGALDYTHPSDAFFDMQSIAGYSARQVGGAALPAWLQFDPATGGFSGTPAASDIGALKVIVTATDSQGLSVSDEFTLVAATTVTNGTDSRNTYSGTSGADVYFARGDNDFVSGGNGNDQLFGGEGNDTLNGGGNDDVIVGGQGDDRLTGGTGSNTFRLEPGDGLDAHAMETSGSHKFQFGAGVSAGGLRMSLVVASDGSAGLKIKYGAETIGDALQLTGVYTLVNGELQLHANAAAYSFEFRDGTVLTLSQLLDLVVTDVGTEAADILRLSMAGTLTGAGGNDILLGSSGVDQLSGGDGNDQIQGMAGADTLNGDAGNDVLAGGAGADMMAGGAGDDTYFVDEAGDNAVEDIAAGIDAVQSSISLTLAANIEDLTLMGSGAINGTGNGLANTVTGNTGGNVLDGAAGADTLIGRAGNDTYIVDTIDDVVIESANEGIDTVQAALSWTLGSNVENLTLVGSASINGIGNVLDNVIIGNSAANTLTGGVGNDTYGIDNAEDVIVENLAEGTDTVQSSISYILGEHLESLTLTGVAVIDATGNAANNQLTGNSGANVLDGAGGSDSMAGGAGNDTYVIDNAGDTVTENASAGTDTVQASVAYTLGNNVENLTLTGNAAIAGTGNVADNILIGNSANNTLTGHNGNDTLDGGGGADALVGGAGNDIYLIDSSDTLTEAASAGTDTVRAAFTYTLLANFENLILTGSANVNGTGNSAVNNLTGNSGDNVLNGGSGADTMAGGVGNDTYIVDNASDVTNESPGEGVDLVQSSVTRTLTGNIENLTLTGTGAINGTGNALDNVLSGNGGNNTLTGQDGNDTLDPGSAGTDSLSGGLGNDMYIVNRGTGITITESAGQGIDSVNASVTHTLAANVDLLFLAGSTAINGTGNTLNNLLRGNSANNTLAGAAGVDILEGGGGTDTLSDSGGNTLFNGGAGNDTLTGTANNDMLIGGIGNDALTTGAGADLIVFNLGDGQDTVSASTTQDNTVCLGGGAVYADLLFQKSGNNLILKLGTTDQITFTNYYASTSNRSVDKLQIVIDGSAIHDPGSSDPMLNKKIETFDFDGLVAAFDTARAADPGLTTWALTNALTAQHLGGSDAAAVGGDLAYRYGRFGTLSDISATPAAGILSAAGFGATAQSLQLLSSLQDSTPRLS